MNCLPPSRGPGWADAPRGLGQARHWGVLGRRGPTRKGWAASALWFSLGLVTSPTPAPFQLAASPLTALLGPSRPNKSRQLIRAQPGQLRLSKGVGEGWAGHRGVRGRDGQRPECLLGCEAGPYPRPWGHQGDGGSWGVQSDFLGNAMRQAGCWTEVSRRPLGTWPSAGRGLPKGSAGPAWATFRSLSLGTSLPRGSVGLAPPGPPVEEPLWEL